MKIAITTHVFATGPGQDLRDYLINKKVEELFFIGHPLFYSKSIPGSSYYHYKNGNLVESKVTKNLNINILIKYFRCFIRTLIWGKKYIFDYDIYVGCNNLNALAGLFLKKMGRVKKCVYYVIDYNPKRFPNKLLNSLYHYIDHVCVKYCDEVWNLSPRMIEGRKDYFGVVGGNQKVVPIGIWFDRIPKNDKELIEKHTVVFEGHLLKKQGVQHLIKAIPMVKAKIPDFKLVIIGEGLYKGDLEAESQQLNISSNVEFVGYIDDHVDLENMLCNCALAVALYNKYEDNGDLTFTYFADPAKLKLYLACGLPILLTDVSYNAKDIKNNGCGIIISTDPAIIARTIIDLLSDSNKLYQMRENAIKYASNYNWTKIFESLI